ncbi:MAG: endolytic transglycosylase MltG [Pseudomonadota bacterium]|nr:endolytic transglycosylase MltG [Pseudomonadota bacterium]
MLKFVSWVASIFILISFIAFSAGLWCYTEFVSPTTKSNSTIVLVEKGSGIGGISNTLFEKRVIPNPIIFELSARIFSSGRVFQAGEYSIPEFSSPRQIVNIFQSGNTVVRRFTAAEGLNTQEIINLVRQTEGLIGKVTIPTAEGELLPETYHFSYGDTRDSILARMKKAMRGTLDELWPRRQGGLPVLTKNDAVILASIVEKETGLPLERARVAGVFINRLRLGMRLQSDPTVIYGLTLGLRSLGRSLNRSDLKEFSIYNTYLNNGLPPSPISNPGRAAINAVLNPIKTKDLYFVADGSGGHVFSSSLSEHNENVRAWRKKIHKKVD